MISVLILTKNEEVNLPHCLASVSWCDDIIILDSLSTDRTVQIAESAGARVFSREFDNERAHREASLELPFKYPWVFNPDADEVASPALYEEMLAAVASGDPAVAYRVRFKNMFMERWIKHSSLYPTWVVRLFRPDAISFRRDINLEYVVDGTCGMLSEHFLHYSFRNGLSSWFEKHNRYSQREAEESLRSLATGSFDWRGLLAVKDAVGRRKALKELSFHLPFRPLLRFLYMYFLRLGFLDGVPGYHYCRLLAIYEYLIVLKMKELRESARLSADCHRSHGF
jgi:glycosyltransferase involved in cell wall biosynthesis